MNKKLRILFACIVLLMAGRLAGAAPVTFTDSTGRSFALERAPRRVVCLVPAVTEMVFRVGAGKAVAGVTYHTTYPPEAALKPIVGGFFAPSLKRIAALKPDLIFASRFHKAVISRFEKTCPVVILEANGIRDIYDHLRIIGRIFNREPEADRLIGKMRRDFALMAKKVAKIPPEKRKRVLRLMGRDRIMTPGDDSFQNEYIRLAGGIPPDFGKKGPIVTVTLDQWRRFNPQVIYGCGGDRAVVEKLLSRPGWRDVEAVRTKAIYFFPCALTCRASTHAAYFVGWLSATLYGDFYAKKANQVTRDHAVSSRPVSLPFDYVRDAHIIDSRVADFINKTLVIRFRHPLKTLSTLEGPRNGIVTVGNHYLPPQLWNISHQVGFRNFRERVFNTLRLREADTSFLMTGADMDHLSIQTRSFKAMRVTALITAGVRSNAMRMSKDTGLYYEPGPGTINILLMTNCRLTPRAMARAIITVTEAKTASLQDLDIRSAYTSRVHQATGTGTDNILVIQGEGIRIDNTGGHSRMGELIAKAVYDGVREAIFKQNGIARRRNVFQRLKERGITLYGLVPKKGLSPSMSRAQAVKALESLLLDPRYAAFVETAVAISDQAEVGLISDLEPFRLWCRHVASGIADREVPELKNVVMISGIPEALNLSLNALLNGLMMKK